MQEPQAAEHRAQRRPRPLPGAGCAVLCCTKSAPQQQPPCCGPLCALRCPPSPPRPPINRPEQQHASLQAMQGVLSGSWVVVYKRSTGMHQRGGVGFSPACCPAKTSGFRTAWPAARTCTVAARRRKGGWSMFGHRSFWAVGACRVKSNGVHWRTWGREQGGGGAAAERGDRGVLCICFSLHPTCVRVLAVV